MVDQTHEDGKKIGVWFERADSKENEELYQQMYDLKVDYFFSDFPLNAMEAR